MEQRKTSDCEIIELNISVQSQIPPLPDDIIRIIMRIKHQNFIRSLPRLETQRRIRITAQMEEREKARQKAIAACELKSAGFLGAVSVSLFVFSYYHE